MAYDSDLVRTKNWGTEILTDADLEGQFDLIINWVMACLNASTGHNHDGSANHGQKISPANLLIASQAQGDTLYASSATVWARLAKGTASQVLTMNAGATAPEWKTPTTYPEETHMVVVDEKAQNTGGGTFTSGAWRTRTLNTEKYNSISGASLAGNQITLPAGTYLIEASAPAMAVDHHQTRLYNITDAEMTMAGSTEYTDNGTGYMTRSFIIGKFTIADAKVFELQHYCSATYADYGLGYMANLTTEVYSMVKITKLVV